MTNKANTFIEEKELMREAHGATLDFYNENIVMKMFFLLQFKK